MYKGKSLDIHKPILSQVFPYSVIVVGKKCIMLMKWNGKDKTVEYTSSTPNGSLIETVRNAFNITIPTEQLYISSQDGKVLSRNQTIPFNGYKEFLLTLNMYDSISLSKKQNEHYDDTLNEQKKNETVLSNNEFDYEIKQKNTEESIIMKDRRSMIAYDYETLLVSRLLSSKYLDYCKNCVHQEGLILIEEWMSVFLKKDNDKHQRIDYNMITTEIKLSQNEGDGSPLISVDLSNIDYNVIIDLSDDGMHWEGTTLHGIPFGYGSLYNNSDELVYRGVMIDNCKQCYGIEFYPGLNTPQYCGCYYMDERHGLGTLYDRKGKQLYEGNWMGNVNDFETSIVLKNWSRDSQLIHCFTQELVFDKKYKAEEKDNVKICELSCLESLVFNCSMKNLGTLKISNNPVLKLIAARDINKYPSNIPLQQYKNS